MMADALKLLWDIGPTVASTIALIWGGFHVPIVRRLGMLAVRTFVTPAVQEEIFLTLLKKLVDRVDNPITDAWIVEFEKGLAEKKAAKKKK